jgi:hypothetical protein
VRDAACSICCSTSIHTKFGFPSPATEHVIVATPRAKRTVRWPVVAGSLIVLVILSGALLWQRPWEERLEPASVEAMAFPLPDKPSIAVLSFNNMSDDASQEYFADGMTEDLIICRCSHRTG